ncbi:MAG: DUF1232 domain-containing protein [Syntrophomonadaceae bacterium]|nr:DUF1232 domain-containing protein [Syntrophomonadaceae bacterium]
MKEMELDYYQKLRFRMKEWLQSDEGKTNQWAEYMMFAPDLFHLLCKLAVDKDVLIADKAKLAGAIVYYLSPVDIIPELLIGPLGFADDIAVAAYVLNQIINHSDPEIVKKHWAGEGEVLEIIQRILVSADQMLGSGLWAKIKQKFS